VDLKEQGSVGKILRRFFLRPRRAVIWASLLLVVGIAAAGAPAEPTATPARYIVSFAAGTSAADQAADIVAAGATDVSAIPALHMHAVDATDGAVTALTESADVVSIEADLFRNVQALPSDPEYPNQWALPRIGWDQARDSVLPMGSATVAVLDTGVDAAHPDLAGQVVPGTSILDASDGTTDPNGHGTWMAGIVAAATDNAIGVAGGEGRYRGSIVSSRRHDDRALRPGVVDRALKRIRIARIAERHQDHVRAVVGCVENA